MVTLLISTDVKNDMALLYAGVARSGDICVRDKTEGQPAPSIYIYVLLGDRQSSLPPTPSHPTAESYPGNLAYLSSNKPVFVLGNKQDITLSY